jgi:hypothetical protein
MTLIILRVPGDAVLLPAVRMERDDFRTRRSANQSRSQMILIETLSPSTGSGLSKTTQFESLPFRGPLQCGSARLSASTKALVKLEALTASAGAHSIGIK